jgi:thioredoxin reductase
MTDLARSVAIIGAGPVGLAAAAHALEKGLNPIVLEAGDRIGHTAREWGHVRMFSPWEYNIDRAAERLLARSGWNSPDPQHYPTGAELVEHYLEPLANLRELKKHIQTSSRVTAISRVGFDRLKTKGREQAQFEIRYQNGAGPKTVLADAVIDASGSWSSPNPAGANGLEAVGESEASDHIAYAMPDVLGRDRDRYANKTVAVLGSGHSAVGTLIDLVHLKESAPQTHVIWLLRGDKPEKAFGGGANDKLSARGELGTAFSRVVAENRIAVEASFKVKTLALKDGRIVIGSDTSSRQIVADDLIVATGFRPDVSFLRELRISLDPALECPPMLAPLIDPNEHSCGTVRPHGARQLAQPETGFYFAGMKSYGRAPTFLLLTGYEQVRSIVAEIAGDREAAERVELVLPETGVCTGSLEPASATSTPGCCGGAPKSDASACCVADETAKVEGKAGCGCG